MSCEYCRNGKDLIDMTDENGAVHIYSNGEMTTQTVYGEEVGVMVNFCPMCGEPLTEPRALTLDEFLKHMEDNSNHPLWMALLEPHQGQWYTVEEIVEEFGYAVRTKGGTNVDFEEYLKEAYGVSFCVYHHKPKE